jgi:hypothetical protein
MHRRKCFASSTTISREPEETTVGGNMTAAITLMAKQTVRAGHARSSRLLVAALLWVAVALLRGV